MMIFQIISLFGTPFFFIPATIYLLSLNKALAIIVIYSIASTQIICTAVKFIYPKSRPIPMPDKTLIQKYMAGSFPSIHTARITAFLVPIAQFYASKAFILAALLAIGLVGYSRIYLKKHYFTDVLGGFAIGAIVSAAVLPAQNYLNFNLNFFAMAGFSFFLLKCFYLMLPAYFANMAPVIVKKIDFLNFPVDFGKELGKKPLFGKHKTFRGIVFGVVFAVIAAYIQYSLYGIEFFRDISFMNYKNWLLLGFLMGLGALTGDLVKSFFKRRLGIAPGAKFVPFDQTDFVMGALVFMLPVFRLDLKIFSASLLLSFVLHIAVNHIAFYLKIRNEKW